MHFDEYIDLIKTNPPNCVYFSSIYLNKHRSYWMILFCQKI